MSHPCIIIGASHAGSQLALSLRQQGWQDEILLISDEGSMPYQRPPLSKSYLSGEKGNHDIFIRPISAFEKANVKILLNTRVTAINRPQNTLTLSNGETMTYAKLALCTGASALQIPLQGNDKQGVHYLRTLQDVQAIRQYVAKGKHAVIIGGGFIGLESAAILNKQGMKVTVLEAQSRVLQRVVSIQVSEFYQKKHAFEGVCIQTNTYATKINGDDHVTSVTDQNGNEYLADLVIIGIGVRPQVQLAQDSGLDIDNGILINEFAHTRDPDIVAAGDATCFHHNIYKRNLRLECIQNAMDQAKAAAASICGKAISISEVIPRFWSDQYNLKLQIIGIADGYDQVEVRGEIENGESFSLFYLKRNTLICTVMVNASRVLMKAQQFIKHQQPVSSQDIDEMFAL